MEFPQTKDDISFEIITQISNILSHEKDREFFTFNKKWKDSSKARYRCFYPITDEIEAVFYRANNIKKGAGFLMVAPKNFLSKFLKNCIDLRAVLQEMNAFWADEHSVFYSENEIDNSRKKISDKFSQLAEKFILLSDTIELKLKLEELEQSFEGRIKLAVSQERQKNETSEAIKIFEDTFFKCAAHKHEEAATIWMLLGLACLMVSTYISYTLYQDINVVFNNELNKAPRSDVPPFLFSGVILSKFVCLSLLIFSNLWILKNYKINKHNELKNRHRSTTLESFTHLIEGAGNDQEARRHILQKVSNTLFDTDTTGYLK